MNLNIGAVCYLFVLEFVVVLDLFAKHLSLQGQRSGLCLRSFYDDAEFESRE